MARAYLFGDWLTITDGKLSAPSNPAISGIWDAPFNTATGVATLNTDLVIGNLCRVTAVLNLRFQPSSSQPQDWVLSAAQPDQPASRLWIYPKDGGTPGATLALSWGPLQFLDNLSDLGLSAGDDLNLRFLSRPVSEGSVSSPISIGYQGAALTLDLRKLQVQGAQGALQAQVGAFFDVQEAPNVPPGPGSFFSYSLPCDPISIPLDQVLTAFALVFQEPPTSAPLPLHVDIDDRNSDLSNTNPLRAPIFLHGYTLTAAYRSNGRGTLCLAGLTVSAAGGGSAGPKLRTEGWRDTQNAPVMWHVDRPLSLHVRTGTDVAPSTFLLAADGNVENPSPAAMLTPVVPAVGSLTLHAAVDQTRHVFPSSGSAASVQLISARRLPSNAPSPDLVDAAIASDATAPYLDTISAPHSLEIAKAGHTYLTSADGDVIHHVFPAAQGVRLPLFPPSMLRAASAALETAHLQDLAPPATLQNQLKADLGGSQHESGMTEAPKGTPHSGGPVAPAQKIVPLTSVFTKAAGTTPPAPDIGEYPLQRGFGDIYIEHTQTRQVDYVLIPDKAQLSGHLPPSLAVGIGNAISFKADVTLDLQGTPGWPIALIKTSRRYSLADIAQMPDVAAVWTEHDVSGLDFVSQIVHPEIARAEWTGCILFNVDLNLDGFAILKSLIGDSPAGVNIAYIALTPEKDGNISVAARVYYEAPDKAPGPSGPVEVPESRIKTELVDISWFDSKLFSFKVKAELAFPGFLGLSHTTSDDPPTVTIEGALDTKSGIVRFLGQFSEPLQVLPPDNHDFGPIKQVYIDGAEIVVTESNGATHVSVQLSGSIVPQSFSVPDMNISFGSISSGGGAIQSIDFTGLGIDLPDNGSPTDWSWLSISYPSIRLNLNIPAMTFGNFLGVKLEAIGIGFDSFDWSKMLLFRNGTVPGADDAKRTLACRCRLDLMKLPELTSVSFDRLSLDFAIALPAIRLPNGGPGAWLEKDMRLALGAFGFDNFDLALMRFLEISAKHVDFSNVTYPGSQASVPELTFADVELKILDNVIIDGMTFIIFTTEDGQTGFLCYLAPNQSPVDLGIVGIDWILVGQNLTIEQNLAEQIVSLDAATEDDDNARIRDAIVAAATNHQFIPLGPGKTGGAWLFAGGFRLFGDMLYGKFLFQDHTYYGICLRGGLLNKVLGLDLAISVLYIEGPTAGEDRFVLSVRVPTVVLPAFTFLGGVVTFDIAMNGSFMVDIGFPSLLPNGSRDWDRSFGVIIDIFQGSGGIYVAKRTWAVTGGNKLQLAGGYALQFGLGASFGADVFRVWVTVGVYCILEGMFTFEQTNGDTELSALQVVGASGILIRGVGELDWWIISVRIEIMASAEARTTLNWASGQPTLLTFDFNLTVSASASACIGGGWFQICADISVCLPINFEQTLRLG